MAILETIFKIPTKGQIGFLKVDAVMSENHGRTAEPTENEVEDGSIISDHVKLGLDTLDMSCIVSDVPVSILGMGVSVDDILGASKDFLNGEKNSFEGLVKNERRKPKDAWSYLDELCKMRIPFSVVTGLQKYDNMIITRLSSPRKSENGKSLYFDISMKKIKIIKSSKVKIPASSVKAEGAASKNDLGKQAGKEATAEQEDNSSLLFKGFKKAGVL